MLFDVLFRRCTHYTYTCLVCLWMHWHTNQHHSYYIAILLKKIICKTWWRPPPTFYMTANLWDDPLTPRPLDPSTPRPLSHWPSSGPSQRSSAGPGRRGNARCPRVWGRWWCATPADRRRWRLAPQRSLGGGRAPPGCRRTAEGRGKRFFPNWKKYLFTIKIKKFIITKNIFSVITKENFF